MPNEILVNDNFVIHEYRASRLSLDGMGDRPK